MCLSKQSRFYGKIMRCKDIIRQIAPFKEYNHRIRISIYIL
ncbi:hypothetical protein HMPREF9419_0912 [Prevotella nigrescens ATCC 33563]|nr:hypothetical protein HMPREF9419_0912 [Prevotella nigrescens ATCC 33563]